MKCEQARDILLDRLDANVSLQPIPDIDVHFRDCQACQAWYRQQQMAATALEKLEPYPVPQDFTARVLAALAERTPNSHPAWPGQAGTLAMRLQQTWRDFAASLSSPIGRRRLAPVLVSAAAVLVVAVCLFAVLESADVPVTPGAAAGSPSGLLLAGSIAVIVLAVLGLLFLRRK